MTRDTETLVDAICETLAAVGAEGFTMEAVAERAGVSPTELGARHASVADLYFDVFVQSFADYAENVLAAISEAKTGAGALNRMIRAQRRFFHARKNVLQLGFFWPQLVGTEQTGLTTERMNRHFFPIATRPIAAVAEALASEWGDDLPTGVHPRRHAFLSHTATIGLQVMQGLADAGGDPMKHTDDDLMSDMGRVLTAPIVALKQLGALNDVSTRLASHRREAELLATVPELLAESLDLSPAGLVVSTEKGYLLVSSSAPPLELDDLESCPEAVRDALRDGEICHGTDALESATVRLESPWVVCPMAAGDRVLGVIFAHGSAGDLDRGVISRLATFSTMVGLAIENVRLYENLQQEVDARTRELRDTQANLLRAAKLASLGQLVAGVAHELNTPLGAVSSARSSLAKAVEKLETDGSNPSRALQVVRSSSDIISVGVERVGAVVQRLRRFARLDEAEVQMTDVHECIDDAVQILDSSKPVGVEIVTTYGDLPTTLARPVELNDLFFNLLINAVQATDGEGRIHLRTRRVGDDLLVDLEDDGEGIEEADLPRVFDPGFTTRGVGVGAGLGLATCHQIVHGHGGEIVIVSERGRGTTVTVSIPVRLASG